MHNELFTVFGLTVYSYGLMLAISFIVGALIAWRRLSERYMDPYLILDFMLAGLVGGVVGARLFYVLGHWSEFSGDLGSIFQLQMEGLVFYGGLAAGILAGLLVAWWRRLNPWLILDIAGLALPASLGIGRIGCLLHGCCYGKVTSVPWGISYPASTGIYGTVHPTQIYEMILDFLLFGFLWWKRDSFEHEGTSLLVFLFFYGIIRFVVEFFRFHVQEHAALAFQVGSLALSLVAGLLLIFRKRILPSRKSGAN